MSSRPGDVPWSRRLCGDDLVLGHFSLDRRHPIDDRVRAAADAGFAGIGLYAGEYRRLVDEGMTPDDLHGLLSSAGLVLAEVEVLSGWARREPSEGERMIETTVWEMVDEFGADYVQAIGPYDGTLADAAAAFGDLCDRAADHGAIVGLEFLPFTNIATLADARAIVERADRRNGGLCLDVWHHTRGDVTLAEVRSLPAELVVAIQMSDGPVRPGSDDYRDDCLRHRVPPGRGTFDVDGFVTTLLELGVDVPWGLEVCSDEAWGRPAGPHVQACADAMREVLERCRTRADNRPGRDHR